ncbi:sulfur carrier protein ThiS [Agromyces sp. SYSU K20354]|uniref:sulfur carrier protein ThiS n=1 Tax=Agromyces cavernae TaxID=2898659 RepID=UPI001E431DAE|nr:sulfur carrier protein ThiS [Agromyces cavernae]MCD2443442.1 sulfur carrier protein ThiS [Agromyces cavernae]
MTITLNGEPAAIPPGGTVADFVPAASNGIAVALNGVVVPRHRHADTRLRDGDEVEIVTAVQGG